MEKVRDNWIRCPHCGHKLFKALEPRVIDGVEIKCHSCKNVVTILRKERGVDGKAD